MTVCGEHASPQTGLSRMRPMRPVRHPVALWVGI
ncbi:hypothetical protein SAM23877_5518 [Streptomyces ambofaciens ATCC 23877]|uniref:Uncharacterized protein n=1 Tax=Streptomyces ambofaciens (strain ATCC 23877 / 3486 / DSM 40053 / JCM 4204 / NBRC 12836 / NRRL B-2516) TaxID=278992 RepID=A0A0K2B034_STRA7|nr:hypothetical protein SAM23877_5518 [Streptomyces ambofaciens ATCC 23877]